MKNVNSILKILLVIIATMLIFVNIPMIVEASSYKDSDKTTYSPKEFSKNPDGKTEGGWINTSDSDNIQSAGGKIVGIIRVVGTMVAVAMITVLGIKYMMGSAEERAEYKKTLFPYLVGAVFIFASTNLTQVVYSWAINLN